MKINVVNIPGSCQGEVIDKPTTSQLGSVRKPCNGTVKLCFHLTAESSAFSYANEFEMQHDFN